MSTPTPTPSTPTTPPNGEGSSRTRSPPRAAPGSYTPARALDDLPGVHYALELFLASKMVESETFCDERDPKKERLYFATGYGLIQTVKAMMSYEDEDLVRAMGHARHGNTVASAHRKRPASLSARLAGFVSGTGTGSGLAFIKSMTPVERHAELVYAESLFEKALLGILYSGDWLAFIKEALNLRATMNIYRDLARFVEQADAAYAASHPPSPSASAPPTPSLSPPPTPYSADAFSPTSFSMPGTPTMPAAAPPPPGVEDPSIDAHFRSGVYLGAGTSALVMSLMPARLLTLVELFGYRGDRALGLSYLMRAGGWSKDALGPSVNADQEGVRRSICDMILLIFHLVLSSFTFEGVDVGVAEKILTWNSQRYPNGVFFLFGHGRLALKRSQPRASITYYTRAMAAQSQHTNLHYISRWEIAVARMALGEWAGSLAEWRMLANEATWSKATYTYGAAACLLELGGQENAEEAAKLLGKVSELKQRIAGKSIPIEKFVARKADKFRAQGSAPLPALELGYHLHALAHAGAPTLTAHMLPRVGAALAALGVPAGKGKARAPAGGALPERREADKGYWDDLGLARFLEGVCWRFVAYPDPEARPEDPGTGLPAEGVSTTDEAAERAKAAFEEVVKLGPKFEIDHYLVYHAHYELGRLLSRMGDRAGAKQHLELVLSGRPLEINIATKKGKYSMENALQMRTHAALDGLEAGKDL